MFYKIFRNRSATARSRMELPGGEGEPLGVRRGSTRPSRSRVYPPKKQMEARKTWRKSPTGGVKFWTSHVTSPQALWSWQSRLRKSPRGETNGALSAKSTESPREDTTCRLASPRWGWVQHTTHDAGSSPTAQQAQAGAPGFPACFPLRPFACEMMAERYPRVPSLFLPAQTVCPTRNGVGWTLAVPARSRAVPGDGARP